MAEGGNGDGLEGFEFERQDPLDRDDRDQDLITGKASFTGMTFLMYKFFLQLLKIVPVLPKQGREPLKRQLRRYSFGSI